MRDLQVEYRHGVPVKVVGPVWRMKRLPVGSVGKYGPVTEHTSDWARIDYEKVADQATLLNPRQSGHEIEGRIRLRGKSYSAFTSGDDNPDGGKGMIIVRSASRQPAARHSKKRRAS